MQRSDELFCPTITFDKALRREMEYRQRLERTHPHLLVALYGTSETQKVKILQAFLDLPWAPTPFSNPMKINLFDEVFSVTPDASKRKLVPECSISVQQSSFNCATTQRQPQNWYPTKKKVKVPQSPSQILQCPTRNVVPSFWCKICKVDCVTEFNFGAHIGGKKHKAKKLEILGNRNTERQASQCASTNRNPIQNAHAVSGSRSNDLNVSNVAAGPICHLSAES